MTKRVKVFTIAHLPPELGNAYVQHMRNFDAAHAGCHFEIMADVPDDVSFAKAIEMARLDPAFKFQMLFERKRTAESG